MSINKEELLNIAKLAKIKVDKDHISELIRDLNNVLRLVEQLNEIDCTNVSPMLDIVVKKAPERKDIVTDGNCVDSILSNVPEKEYNLFSVPKVIE